MDEEIIGKDGASMVHIPAGEFRMGSTDDDIERFVQAVRDFAATGQMDAACAEALAAEMLEPGGRRDTEMPAHTVHVDAFYMDMTPVTVGLYKKFMAETGYTRSVDWWHETDPRDGLPVNATSPDAQAYCEWAGKRLPTEAEWEKAARGGAEGRVFPWGDALEADACNCEEVRTDGWGVTPVGLFPPNGYGLYDIVGNVKEWCSDRWDPNYYAVSPKDNPRGPDTGECHILRGGCAIGKPVEVRVAMRDADVPACECWGFRCAMDAN